MMKMKDLLRVLDNMILLGHLEPIDMVAIYITVLPDKYFNARDVIDALIEKKPAVKAAP